MHNFGPFQTKRTSYERVLKQPKHQLACMVYGSFRGLNLLETILGEKKNEVPMSEEKVIGKKELDAESD